jgi:hypothetical protein
MINQRRSRGIRRGTRPAPVAAIAVLVLVVAGGCGDVVGIGAGRLEILYPIHGAALVDEVILQARVPGRSLDDYEIYWYVDDSRERRMWNAWDYRPQHKAYVVDTWFWNWRGAGPYTIGFIAEDRYGRQIDHRTVRVYVY